MAERITERTERKIVRFTEAEFKDLLGITEPEGVLTVSVSFSTGQVSVTLCQER